MKCSTKCIYFNSIIEDGNVRLFCDYEGEYFKDMLKEHLENCPNYMTYEELKKKNNVEQEVK
jgi:hypothetical protein